MILHIKVTLLLLLSLLKQLYNVLCGSEGTLRLEKKPTLGQSDGIELGNYRVITKRLLYKNGDIVFEIHGPRPKGLMRKCYCFLE